MNDEFPKKTTSPKLFREYIMRQENFSPVHTSRKINKSLYKKAGVFANMRVQPLPVVYGYFRRLHKPRLFQPAMVCF